MPVSNVGYWINPTAEYLVPLVLADTPFFVPRLESPFFGLLRLRMYDLRQSSFIMTLFSPAYATFLSLPLLLQHTNDEDITA